MFKVQFPTSFPRLTADVRRVVNRILLPLALRSTSSHGHMHLTLNVWEVWVQLFLPQVCALPYPQQFQTHLESQIGQFVGCRWIVQVFIVWQDFLPPSVANIRTALQVWLSLPVMHPCHLPKPSWMVLIVYQNDISNSYAVCSASGALLAICIS